MNTENEESVKLETMELRLKWKEIASVYSVSYTLYIGRVRVVSFHYDGGRQSGDKQKYQVSSTLPSIKSNLGRYETEQEAREMCINVAKVFLKQLQDI